MKPDTQLLKSVWEKSSERFCDRNTELNRLELDQLVSSMFSNGPFYFYVIDFAEMRLQHVSPSIRDIHGLDPDKVAFQEILDRMHPEDMDFVSRAEAKAFELAYEQLAPGELTKYKVSYCFRLKTADGSFRLFNHQAIVLTTDEEGRIGKALNIHTDISHLTETNNYRLSMIGLLGAPSFLNINPQQEATAEAGNESIFSEREMEIIRLMSQGLTSRDIAGQLSIAANTVKNHRKNILQKADCRNAGQLITKCITDGLL